MAGGVDMPILMYLNSLSSGISGVCLNVCDYYCRCLLYQGDVEWVSNHQVPSN